MCVCVCVCDVYACGVYVWVCMCACMGLCMIYRCEPDFSQPNFFFFLFSFIHPTPFPQFTSNGVERVFGMHAAFVQNLPYSLFLLLSVSGMWTSIFDHWFIFIPKKIRKSCWAFAIPCKLVSSLTLLRASASCRLRAAFSATARCMSYVRVGTRAKALWF